MIDNLLGTVGSVDKRGSQLYWDIQPDVLVAYRAVE